MTDQPGYVVPAGWYVDPTTAVHLRWWSGLAWTEHVAPIPEVAAVPDDYPEVAPARPQAFAPVDQGAAADQADVDQADVDQALVSAASADVPLPPPPVPLIAPVSSYGWEREVSRSEVAPRRTLPVGYNPEYTAIPSRWSTVSVWVIAFVPWIPVVTLNVMVALGAAGTGAWLLWCGLALPWLITLAAAQRDVARLSAWGHQKHASWTWALLGAPAYLIARTVVMRRNTGLGSAPLWIWLANFLLVTGACAVLILIVAISFPQNGNIHLTGLF